MFDTIKRWFLKMQTLSFLNDRICPFEALNETLKSLVDRGITHAQILEHIQEMDDIFSERATDPRELPRPCRHLIEEKLSEPSYKHSTKKINSLSRKGCCSCHNCNVLTLQFTECAICLQPIQTQSVRHKVNVTSCRECGNIACRNCATKIIRCPYCRSNAGLKPNFALQRLINDLEIPCKRVSLSEMDRPTESESFEYNFIPLRLINKRVLCLHKNCEWMGDRDKLAQHMADLHACFVFEGSSVSLIINEFKRKAKLNANKPRNYCLVLSYLPDIYVCKIMLMETKLKLVLVSVSKVEITDFCLSIKIGCNTKTIEGVIPFSKKRANVSVCMKSLMSLCKKKSDAVTINLTILCLR